MKVFIIIFTLLISLNISHAAVEIKKFESQQHEQRYKKLLEELRCLVCQNQNLAGSDAGLAQDLRKQVYKMISAGDSDKEILDFMVTRYGDFILYRPPFKSITYLLWIGPFVILLIGMFVLIRFIRQRKKNVATILTNNDKEKLKLILDEDKEQDK